MTDATLRHRRLIEELFDGKLRLTKIAVARRLNVSVKTVDRYLTDGRLLWAGNQVSVVSIIDLLSSGPRTGETAEEVEMKMQRARSPQAQPRRTGGWVSRW